MWGPIEATAGPVVPLVFLGALAIILPTVLSYASLNRHAPSAGAAASWLRSSFGVCPEPGECEVSVGRLTLG